MGTKKSSGSATIVALVIVAVLLIVSLGGIFAIYAYYKNGPLGKVGDLLFGSTSSQVSSEKASDCATNPTDYGCQAPNITTGISNVYDPTSNGENGVPYFQQTDSRYHHVQIPPFTKTIGYMGCCFTSAAMVLRYYNKPVDPVIIGQLEASWPDSHTGNLAYFDVLDRDLANKYGLKAVSLGTDWGSIESYLEDNKPVLTHGKGGKPYSSGGHCVVFSSYDKATDSIYVLNPAPGLGMGFYPVSVLKKYTEEAFYMGP